MHFYLNPKNFSNDENNEMSYKYNIDFNGFTYLVCMI